MKYLDLGITRELEIIENDFHDVGEVKFGSYQAKPYNIPVHHIDKYYVHTQGYAYAIVKYSSEEEKKIKINNLIKVFANHHNNKAKKHIEYAMRITTLSHGSLSYD